MTVPSDVEAEMHAFRTLWRNRHSWSSYVVWFRVWKRGQHCNCGMCTDLAVKSSLSLFISWSRHDLMNEQQNSIADSRINTAMQAQQLIRLRRSNVCSTEARADNICRLTACRCIVDGACWTAFGERCMRSKQLCRHHIVRLQWLLRGARPSPRRYRHAGFAAVLMYLWESCNARNWTDWTAIEPSVRVEE